MIINFRPDFSKFLCFLLFFVRYFSIGQSPQIHKKFEYKHSFRGPNLAHQDGTISFWKTEGSPKDVIASSEQIRLAPSIRSYKGRAWNLKPMTESEFWIAEMKINIKGSGHLGADGLGFWYTQTPIKEGGVFGANDRWVGLGVFFDSFDNDNKADNPAVVVMYNDGTREYKQEDDGTTSLLARCQKNFRNRPFPVKAKIEYWQYVLTVYVDTGFSDQPNYELCARSENLLLPKAGYFGLSAATGGLTDDHDVLSFEVYSLSAVAPQPPAMMPLDEKQKFEDEYRAQQEKFRQEQEKFKKEHPEKAKLPAEDQFNRHEDLVQRDLRLLREGQSSCINVAQQLHGKIDQCIVQIQNLAQRSAVASAGGAAVPVDTFQRHEVNEVLQYTRDMSAGVRDIRNAITDLQSRIITVDNRLTSGGIPQAQVGGGDFEAQKAHLEVIKRELEQIRLTQRTQNLNCPTVETNCLSPLIFVFVIVVQFIAFVLYSALRGRNEKAKFY